MPGSNAGTGRPLSFQCAACRRRKARALDGSHRRAALAENGRADRVWLTGAKRYVLGNTGSRNDEWSREYICEDCNHQGWSRHIDLKYKAERE